MPRYAAFLRGVMPMNAKMPELKQAFETAGFADVKTLLSSGNVAFTAPSVSEAALQRKAEAAMNRRLGAKRIVTFLREPPASKIRLPSEVDGARILAVDVDNVFSAYVRTPKGPVFMTLIQKTFSSEQTTRTWDTVTKVAR